MTTRREFIVKSAMGATAATLSSSLIAKSDQTKNFSSASGNNSLTDTPNHELQMPGSYNQQDDIDVTSLSNQHFKSDNTLPALQWFPEAKFGVFIHWTLTNVALTPGEENLNFLDQAKSRAARFSAENFDAKKWAKDFKSWGAKYAVLTTKHHIGFALFDGPAGFSVMTSSPVKRDLVLEFTGAMRAEGIKVGLYYSLPDWSHPDYASLTNVKAKPEEQKATRAYAIKDDPLRWNRFVKQMFAEVRHLCTAYGKIDLLWFDGDWERSAEQWQTMELAKMIYELQPGCVINNRLRSADLGHYNTPENVVPLSPREGWWEFCMTPGDNWDGIAANTNIKPANEIVRIVGDVLGMGGNFLINVAPLDKGAIPKVQWDNMDQIGQWITSHSQAVYNTRYALPHGLFNGAVTRKGATLFLIAYDTPRNELVLKGTNDEVLKITHPLSGKELKYHYSGGFSGWGKKGWLYIEVPESCMDKYATVVKVEFKNHEVKFDTPSGEKIIYKD